MGTITEVSRQKRDEKRVNVYVDNKFAVGLDMTVAAKHGLKKGLEISDEELKKIERESESSGAMDRAMDRAMHYLSFRARTAREIRRYLTGKGYSDELAESVTAKLTEYGLVDDFAFCREYVTVKGRRAGKVRLRADLKKLGADEAAIDEALEAVTDQSDAAYSLAEKYMRTHRGCEPVKLKRYLFAHGFSSEDISAAVARAREEHGFSEDDDE